MVTRYRGQVISVIIPLMRISPYDDQVGMCWELLQRQVADKEIIVEEQPVESHINKNRLLNRGFDHANGDIIFHCDADFMVRDHLFLRRAAFLLSEYEVLFPMYISPASGMLKVSDGGPVMRREVLEDHGPLDESLLGISRTTFPFMAWCLKNKRCYWTEDLTIELDPRKGPSSRVHYPTLAKTKKYHGEIHGQLHAAQAAENKRGARKAEKKTRA